MALQRIPGVNNHWLAEHPPIAVPPALVAYALDAAADRIVFIGRFMHEGGASKTVDGVEFLFGTVSKANGSTMQVSLQDVSLTTGPVIQEDGTPDQTLTIANADAGFVTNAWYGGDFDAAGTRTLAIGELVCVVFQFASFVAGDSVNLRMLTTLTGTSDNQSGVITNLTGTYAGQLALSNVVFRCTDGTFGTLSNAWPCTGVATQAFNVGTAGADEYALAVQLPFAYRSEMLWITSLLAGSTFATEYLLYSGTTALQTVTIDHNALRTGGAAVRLMAAYPEQTHTANTLYRVAIRPTGTTNINTYTTSVNHADHFSCLPGGAVFTTWTRLDQGGTWTALALNRLLAGIRFSAFDDGIQAVSAPLQKIPGVNNHWLTEARMAVAPSFTSLTLDAAADRITMVGRFCHQDGVSKSVDGLEFSLGATTKTNGSTLQVSLQDPDLTTGTIVREDGTPDQTLLIANADAGFASNLWYGGDFTSGSPRAVAIGDLVCVVFQFGSFVAGDSVAIRMLAALNTGSGRDNQNGVVVNLSGSYVQSAVLANVVLRCTDGTFGTLENAWPCSAVNTHTFNASTAVADEYALGVQLPFPYETDAITIPSNITPAGQSTEYLLYEGVTAQRTITVDHDAIIQQFPVPLRCSYAPFVHNANALYRLSIRPTGAGDILAYSLDVNEVGHMSCLPGGAAFHTWTRLNQGAWEGEVPTRRLLAGIRLNAFDNGLHGNSGPLVGGGRLSR
jgi:hypothetical protein